MPYTQKKMAINNKILGNSTGHFIKAKFISIIRTVRRTHEMCHSKLKHYIGSERAELREGSFQKRKTGKHRKKESPENETTQTVNCPPGMREKPLAVFNLKNNFTKVILSK